MDSCKLSGTQLSASPSSGVQSSRADTVSARIEVDESLIAGELSAAFTLDVGALLMELSSEKLG